MHAVQFEITRYDDETMTRLSGILLAILRPNAALAAEVLLGAAATRRRRPDWSSGCRTSPPGCGFTCKRCGCSGPCRFAAGTRARWWKSSRWTGSEARRASDVGRRSPEIHRRRPRVALDAWQQSADATGNPSYRGPRILRRSVSAAGELKHRPRKLSACLKTCPKFVLRANLRRRPRMQRLQTRAHLCIRIQHRIVP